MTSAPRRIDRIVALGHYVRAAADLLLGRRLLFFCILDAGLVLWALIGTWASGGSAAAIFERVCLWPTVLLALLTLPAVVDVDRRSGALDLVLTMPRPFSLYLHRLMPPVALLVTQSAVLLWLLEDLRASLWAAAVVTCALSACLVAALVLFWALVFRGEGAVALAAALSIGALSPWVLFNPLDFDPSAIRHGIPWWIFEWLWSSLITALAVAYLLFLASRRLARPEPLLG